MREVCILTIWGFTLLLLKISSCTGDSNVVNPCCYFPCQHAGVCVRFDTDRFECDCTDTGFYGENCTTPEFWTRIRQMLKPRPSFLHFFLTHFHWFWKFVNSSFLRDTFMKLVLTARTHFIPSPPTFNSKYGYLNWESFYNLSYYTRLLPPVPEDCPLPMGTIGKPTLPNPKLLLPFFKRTKFRPDPQGTSVMFVFMAQHFTHQFFQTDFQSKRGFTKALGHGIDAGHIYGGDLRRQLHLRLFKDGKLKYQLINGDVYPPKLSEAPVHMLYPKHVPPEERLAIGHAQFGLLPGLTMYATLWLREHNRVCDVLKAEHPTWNDEQLFQTSRLIIIGEIICIVIEEYVQQLSGYLMKLKFDPEMLFDAQFQYSNRIALEFSLLYHWHPLVPDSFHIDGHEIPLSQFLFNTSTVWRFGIEKLVDGFSRQHAGQICGGYNSHESLLYVSEMVLNGSREARVQPFNQYRRRFGLKPYASFKEFTDSEEMAKGLEELYGDIEALEFYPGLLLEKPIPGAILGESMVEMGAPFSLKGVLSNPICSPHYWKPSTFGGETGFNIIKTATLKKLVCQNTKWCPYVDYHVPRNEEEAKPRQPPSEL
ncbi:prostaglandin G/H synthase 1-like [Antennarius striatus]|uniref:prostaglandin G/H synthase 1-like n=1 Tax=Antennarius striatus TaxID=241820 RepID=UPI0035ADD9D4